MSTRNYYSLPGIGKCYYNWTGESRSCPPGPGAPPSGWYAPTFDDKSWGSPELFVPEGTYHFAVDLDNCESVTATSTSFGICPIQPAFCYYRIKISLPRIPLGLTISSILLSLNINEDLQGIWWNGNFISPITWYDIDGHPTTQTPPFGPTDGLPLYNISIPLSSTVTGLGENVLALETSIGTDGDTGQTVIQYSLQVNITDIVPDWLIVAEPVTGITDQTPRLYQGNDVSHNFTLQSRQRGSANYTLICRAGDNYTPTIGTQMWFFDQNLSGFTNVFSGIIQQYKNRQIGANGDRYIDCTASSLEVVFDVVYATPIQFVDQSPDQIVIALYNAFCVGSQVSLGVITSSTTVIPLFVTNYEKLSDLFSQLATTAEYIWGVNPQTQALFFCPPSEVAAPFELTQSNALWDTLDWSYDAADYRNRQAVKLSYDAFSHSMEYFVGNGTQTSFTLMRPVNQVTNCYITLSTCNTALGVFTANPAVGDTITIGPYTGAAWIANHIYAVGGVIVVNGFVQKVTAVSGAGRSGPTEPAFNEVTGGTYQDYEIIWTCQGLLNLATGNDTYTFVLPLPTLVWQPTISFTVGQQIINNGYVQQCSVAGTTGSTKPTFSTTTGGTTTDGSGSPPLTWICEGVAMDNTQFGQVVIDPGGPENTCTNLMDAINSNATTRGTAFSLPTWECTDCLAVNQVGNEFTLQQKGAGSGWISSVSTTSSAFSWKTSGSGSPPATATFTSGGTSPQGSVGPNEGATISIQCYAEGTSTASPGVSYVQGSAVVNLATPLASGTNMNIEYTRMDGNVIECENTELVLDLVNETYGEGKYQQITDQSSQGLISTSSLSGLQLAQQALAAFDIVPFELEVEILPPGILPGQIVTVNLSGSLSALSYLNNTYYVEELRAQFIPCKGYNGAGMDSSQAPGAGHYRYTLKLIDVAQLGSYMDFWQGFGGSASGSGGGASAGSSLVSTSGGGQSTAGTALTVGTVNEVTSNYTAVSTDYGKIIVCNCPGGMVVTLPALPFVPLFPQWWIEIQNIATGTVLIQCQPGSTTQLDGLTSPIQRGKNGGVIITSDGQNFFTERAGPLLETNGTINSDNGVLNLAQGAGVTLTETGGTVTISASSGGGGLVRIGQVICASSQTTVNFTSIPGGYTTLVIQIIGRSSATGTQNDTLAMTFNGDTSPFNYNWCYIQTYGGGVGNGSVNPDSKIIAGSLPMAGVVANVANQTEITIVGYAQSTFFKGSYSECQWGYGGSGSYIQEIQALTGLWQSTAPITSISFALNSGGANHFIDGSIFTLYAML